MEGDRMVKDVKIIEGGRLIDTTKMHLKPVKEFSNEITLLENEEGQAVIYFKKKDEYILVQVSDRKYQIGRVNGTGGYSHINRGCLGLVNVRKMVFVDTSDAESRQRNERLSRMMIESARSNKWLQSQVNKECFYDKFDNFQYFDNNGNFSIEMYCGFAYS